MSYRLLKKRMPRAEHSAEARFMPCGIYDSVKARLITIDETAVEDLAYRIIVNKWRTNCRPATEKDSAKTVDAHYKLRRMQAFHHDITANVVGTLHIEQHLSTRPGNLRATGALLLRESVKSIAV